MFLTLLLIGSDGWRLKFTHNDKKILEIYFGRDEAKCKTWMNAIKEMKNPVKRSKTTKEKLLDSFSPIQDLDGEEVEVEVEEHKRSIQAINSSTPSKFVDKKTVVTSSSSQRHIDTQD